MMLKTKTAKKLLSGKNTGISGVLRIKGYTINIIEQAI